LLMRSMTAIPRDQLIVDYFSTISGSRNPK